MYMHVMYGALEVFAMMIDDDDMKYVIHSLVLGRVI